MKFLKKASSTENVQDRWVFRTPLCLALGITLIVELFNHKIFTTGPAAFLHFVGTHPLALLVNLLLVLITLLPGLFLRRRAFWYTLLSAVWVIMGGVNGFILMSRMTPFTTADLTVLNTGLDTLPNYLSKKYIVLLAVCLVLLAAGLILLVWKGPRSSFALRRRFLQGGIALVLCGGLLAGSWALAFRTGQLSNLFSNLAFAYDDYGFAYCFLQTWLNQGVRHPKQYSAAAMDRIAKEIAENAEEAGADVSRARTDVNVVFVQLESFIDPEEILGLSLSEDAVPNWHAMEEEFTSGYLRVPVVGAGTANTEFEMLTGMSSLLFGPGEYPYKTCLLDETTESVAYDLKELGYATHAIHNHRATFYGRNQVYANLGFDDFTSLEYMPRVQRTPRNWSKDYILTSQILSAMDATENQADLVFTVSVQGHGSYPTQPLLEDPAIQVTACPAGVDARAMEYYVNQLREMDLFLKDLTEQLAARDERTILVLYGDHLPALNLTDEMMASRTLYKTNYIVWDNFRLREKDGDLCAYQLAAHVLGRLRIPGGTVSQFHQYCSGEVTYRTDLNRIQYDLLYGQQYLYGGENPHEPTELRMGIRDIQVERLYQSGDKWYVQGQNFTPYCKVTCNGSILKTSYISTAVLRINEDPGTNRVEDLYISVVDLHKEVLSDTE